MSTFICPTCQSEHAIFGHHGARDEAVARQVPFLGALPLNMDLRVASDAGAPLAPTHPVSRIYSEMAQKVWDLVRGR